jgi:hypothetical protein
MWQSRCACHSAPPRKLGVYFFSHIDELAGAGVIGLLFGVGNSGSTSHAHAMNDGITNPAPLCNSDGLSSGQICANHASTVSDDGGYIRMQAQQYYAGGGYQFGASVAMATSTALAATVVVWPAVGWPSGRTSRRASLLITVALIPCEGDGAVAHGQTQQHARRYVDNAATGMMHMVQ